MESFRVLVCAKCCANHDALEKTFGRLVVSKCVRDKPSHKACGGVLRLSFGQCGHWSQGLRPHRVEKKRKIYHTHTRAHSNPLGKADNENQFQFERETDREEMR